MIFSKDNEFYRGAREDGPTLQEYSTFDEYFAKDKETVTENDLPVTREEESVSSEAAAPKEKSSLRKIVKMLKLTAAAIVTVSVAGLSIAGGGGKIGKIPTDFNFKWPHSSYIERNHIPDDDWGLFSSYYSTSAENGNEVQFAINGVAYRLEDPSKALSFLWSNSTKGMANLIVHDYVSTDSYSISLSLDPFSAEKIDSNNAYGTISSTTGTILYLEARSHYSKGERINTSAELSALMHQLVVRSHIEAPGEWGKIMIGDTLYSDLNENWSGTETTYRGSESQFSFIMFDRTDVAVLLEDEKTTLEVNDISWTLYLQKEITINDEYHQNILWILPEVNGEKLILGVQYDEWQNYCRESFDFSKEEQEKYGSVTEDMMFTLLAEKLHYYHVAPTDWYLK